MYEEFDTCKIIKCATGYTLINNVCNVNNTCPIGQYNNNGVCVACTPVTNVFDTKSYDSNCKVTKCRNGYKVNNINNTCDICPTVNKATIYDGDCKVTTCEGGYKVNNINNTCDICPSVANIYAPNYYNANCNPMVCKAGFLLQNNNCDTPCTNNLNIDSYYIGCSINNCKDGYMVQYVSNIYTCVCESVINSTSINPTTCEVTGCATGYSISGDKKKCILNCDSGKILLNSICIKECPSGQIIINDTCTSYTDEYKFTNCNAIGNLGPTITQCNTVYSNTNLSGKITMETLRQGIQIWTVSATGKYHITCAGAGIQDDFENCRGVIISSVFNLIEGEKIKILVGQSGDFNKEQVINKEYYYGYAHGSGSGGTFVVKFTKDNDYTKDNNIPLIVAGGGGGKFYGNKYKYQFDNSNFYAKKDFSNALYTTSGQNNIYLTTKNTGGIDGNGGDGSSFSRNGYGGGGFYTDGTKKITDTINCNGKSFLNGGNGGIKYDPVYVNGGFGGGTAPFGYNGSGGGYSGGASSSNISYQFGYGGGSYCLNTMEKLGYNNGMGYVNIKYLGV